ncbi:hypothetical protein [Subtercola lobariae]|uniref:YrhK domain-containing protein n=1 Tax=Subtercola lobariae TaxID=1588641 RepID=A0A917B982_9MICO|nr:hypothetical protein [Subtercola lobariae]GGF29200.1 hypothetical protein GCM10011399_22920 [Subtercola lobariae]
MSSVFAVIATTERESLWNPRAKTWRCSWLTMVGSVLFGVSAVNAYVLPESHDLVSLFWANLVTFTGATCFFAAAVLSRPGVASHSAADPAASPSA